MSACILMTRFIMQEQRIHYPITYPLTISVATGEEVTPEEVLGKTWDEIRAAGSIEEENEENFQCRLRLLHHREGTVLSLSHEFLCRRDSDFSVKESD